MAVLRRDDGRIGFAGLVCDLVLVFAITEVSDSLLAQDDPKGAHQTGFLLLAVWWARIASTWVLNRPMTGGLFLALVQAFRSEEHTSELQSRQSISYAVLCL